MSGRGSKSAGASASQHLLYLGTAAIFSGWAFQTSRRDPLGLGTPEILRGWVCTRGSQRCAGRQAETGRGVVAEFTIQQPHTEGGEPRIDTPKPVSRLKGALDASCLDSQVCMHIVAVPCM